MSLARTVKAEAHQTLDRAGDSSSPIAQPVVAPHWAYALPIQPSLKINAPGDKYEQEAERVADQVMRVPESAVQRKSCTCGRPASPDSKCAECKRKELSIQRMAQSDAEQATAPASVNRVINQPGRSIDQATRNFMESRFGENFGHVRIHTDGQAAASAEVVNARAYTVGRNIVFGAGQYSPGNSTGKSLLAHELTHVLQQGEGASSMLQRTIVVSEGPFDQAPADDPARRLTGAERFDTVNDLVTELSPSFEVDSSSGEVKPTGIDCSDPDAVEAGSNPVANCCLCTLSAPTATPWTIFVSETVFPHTSERARRVVTPPADSAIEYGHWTAADQRAMMSRTLVLGHELCGHAALMELNAHPDPADRTTTNVHDPTVRIQNALAAEQGADPSEARGLAASGTHRGESLARITVKQFPLNGLWTSQIPVAAERRKVDLAARLMQENAMWVDIVGHSDTTGTVEAKQSVSEKRAEQMKQTLLRRNVSDTVSRQDLEDQGRFASVGAFADSQRFTSVRGVSDSQPPTTSERADDGNWRRVEIFMTAFPAGAANIPSGTPTAVNPVPTPSNVSALAASSNACHSRLIRDAFDIP